MTGVPALTVVGSANLDYVVPVPRHPVRGETVLGGDHVLAPGGKGANQAVAAARLGAPTSFVGAVGDDAAGALLRRSLDDAGVDTTALVVDQDRPSGIALITVDPDGDNAIVVSPGANHAVSPERVEDARFALEGAQIVLLQLEIPVESVAAAATSAGGTVILDPAPAPSDALPTELLHAVDVLVPNETELAILAGVDHVPSGGDELTAAARSLPVDTLVVTLGAAGALVVTPHESTSIPSPSVEAIDTTGAGDAFRAALAHRLLHGDDLVDAARFAVRVGAATTMVLGAQPSLPTAAEVDERLGTP